MRHIYFLLLVVWSMLAACRDATDSVDALAFKAAPDGKWGLITTDGQILAAADTYDRQPTAVVNGLFSLPDAKGFYQLYNIKGSANHPVTPRRFARIGHFFENVAPAQETMQSPIILIDRLGRTVASTAQYPQYDIVLMHNFCEGRALFATREGKYGYMDVQGEVVIPPLYDRAYDFCDGLALVGMTNPEGKTGYQLIAPNGRTKLAIQLSNCLLSHQLGSGLLMYKDLESGACCYLDKEGVTSICLPEEVKEAYPFHQGMAIFQTATGTGVIDAIGNVLVTAHYEDARIMGSGRLALKVKGKWAVAESDGHLLSDFQYDALGSYYKSGNIVASLQGKRLFIDRQGEPVDENRYAFLAEDTTALHIRPQVFIRREVGTGKGKEKEKLPERKTPDATQETPVNKQHLSKESQTPARSTIGSNDWKEIGKQNPFYEEAAKVISGNLEENDAGNRRMILNYVEHLRTSYTTKDIDFLEQLFSENALIVVGTVVHTSPQEEKGYLSPTQVVYNVKTKRQYMDRLKQVFRANRSIRVEFSQFRITRHPTQPGIYGVSLRQGYSSDLYSDDGYLFLLWDFRDKTAPKIHVRTWQPTGLDHPDGLPEEEIFSIRNFNLQ